MNEFQFNGRWEEIKYRFDAFKGFQNRYGSYDTISDNELSDGTIVLNITAESNDSFEPNQSQINTINWISSNAILIKKAIFKAVKIYHDKWKDVLDPQDDFMIDFNSTKTENCLLYTSPSPRDRG